MTDYEPYWICKGPKKDPHPEEEVEQGERCPICDRDRATAEKGDAPQLPLGKILGGLALLAFLGLGGLFFFSRFKQPDTQITKQPATQTNPTNPTNPTTKQPATQTNPTSNPPQTSNPDDYLWEPTRFTKGQRTLFTGKGNVSRDDGIEAFIDKDYDAAVKFFRKAVDASRNDPEVLILYNNALARQQGNNRLTLAAVVPVEGRATSAEEMLRGIAMAQNQFNASRGANEQLLEVVIANDGNKPENAEKVAEQLVNDKSVLGVIGHNSSSASGAGLKMYGQEGLAMISPTSTSTSLEGDVFFRTVPSDAAAGKKLAQYVENTLNLSRVVIFYNPNSSYSDSLHNAFENNFSGTVIKKIDISDRNLDIQGELYPSVYNDKAQAALLFPNADYASKAIEIAKVNTSLPEAQRLKLIGGDALYSPDTLTNGGESVEGLVLAVPWFRESPSSETYNQASKQQWGGDVNWRTAMSYDATQAFIAAFSTNPNRASILERLGQIQLSSGETSGDEVQFTTEGERQGEPVLVQATRGAKGRPQGSEFGFELVQPTKLF